MTHRRFPRSRIAPVAVALLLVLSSTAGAVALLSIDSGDQWRGEQDGGADTTVDNGSLAVADGATNGTWSADRSWSEERDLSRVSFEADGFDNWTGGSEILENPNDPMLVVNPNSSTGYKFQMVVNDNGAGDVYQSHDGDNWTLTHDSYYGKPVGDCRIKDGIYHCVNGKGWVYRGDGILNLTNTSTQLPIKEGSWLYKDGTWYGINGSGTSWQGSCCVGTELSLYTADKWNGSWERQGVIVDRSGDSWGTGDPYLVEIGDRFYVFADKSSDHPYYHVALFTSDELVAGESNWTYRGQITQSYGGDPQVGYDQENDTWLMMNEFPDPPDTGVRLRTSESGPWDGTVDLRVDADTDGDGVIESSGSYRRVTAKYGRTGNATGRYSSYISSPVESRSKAHRIRLRLSGPAQIDSMTLHHSGADRVEAEEEVQTEEPRSRFERIRDRISERLDSILELPDLSSILDFDWFGDE